VVLSGELRVGGLGDAIHADMAIDKKNVKIFENEAVKQYSTTEVVLSVVSRRFSPSIFLGRGASDEADLGDPYRAFVPHLKELVRVLQ
jgi:hypothetical protein